MLVKTSKDSIELKLKEFSDLFSKEVKKLDTFCVRIKNKVDVMIGSNRTMIEDIHSFNKGYTDEMKLKTEADGKLFVNIEKSLKGRFLQCFHLMVVGSLKDSGEEKGKLMGKLISTQILTSLPMKAIMTISSNVKVEPRKDNNILPNVKVDFSKLQSKKWINIGEEEEKKKLQELKTEKLRRLNSIMRQRVNDPPGLNKGDPNKVWRYEMIESTTFSKDEDFFVKPK
ncbi:unnamed protein product [Lactuca saligna]|uniref:Uncharacterized protein n=1 Tax=Lactuca saligna TaxID=75948 RepID=A0AA35ZW03_LACSI|nr:unnamed protein product [Lactuca saligna]